MAHTDPKDNKILKLEKENERIRKQLTKFAKDRYGLFWFDVPEGFDNDIENKLPILEEVPKLTIKNKDDKPTHILIEGDNYHALTCLNYTHKGKIDVIYIDPPYNTGSGFKYKDKRFLDKYPDGTEVPKESPHRHSYWLSFMNKRLELAKNLIKESGVVFISIDDNEVAQLKLLCDSIFGEDNVEIYIWNLYDKTEGSFVKTPKNTVRKEHEYIIACFYDKNLIKFNKYTEFRYKDKDGFSNPNNDPRGSWMSGNISRNAIKTTTGSKYFTITTPAGIKYTRNWSISKEEYDDLLKDDRLYFSNGGKGVPRIKVFQDESSQNTQSSIFSNLKTSKTGKRQLLEIFSKIVFDFPKPTSLIKRLITIASSDKNSLILDFFAGTGTTGHAVMELNKEDGGKRQFILATNNDEVVNGEKYKIMTDICYPRIKKCLNIYKESVKYYKTAFVGKNNILNTDDKDKIELAHNAGAMLAIAENTLEEVKKNSYYQLFENKKQYTAVYFREEFDKFDVFTKKIRSLKKPVAVYIFSWEKEMEFNEFENDKNITVKTIPQPILEIYKRIYNLI